MRVFDWPEKMIEFLEARRRLPFKFGSSENDCCSFAAAWVKIANGVDCMAVVPAYASAEEADVLLETPLDEMIDKSLPRRDPQFAQRGDIGLAKLGNGCELTVVIVEGATLVGPGKRGIARVPRGSALVAAWEV
jgi:hypothetical protein